MAPTLLGDALDALPDGHETVVVQHLGATSEHRDTVVTLDRVLADAARERGLAWTRAAAPGSRPTLMRAVADRVQTVEREAEWTVPEDRLRAEVAAAWAALDAEAEEE
jgi:hypothetical protein